MENKEFEFYKGILEQGESLAGLNEHSHTHLPSALFHY
jgi:hypothetical protein